eukprot:scaffold209839_cov22-Attheya_sp.AAC.1
MNVWITQTTTCTNKETNTHDKDGWLRVDEAKCTVVTEMEEEVWIESEEDALEVWRDMSEDARTCHLAAVPSPDGVLVLRTSNSHQRLRHCEWLWRLLWTIHWRFRRKKSQRKKGLDS